MLRNMTGGKQQNDWQHQRVAKRLTIPEPEANHDFLLHIMLRRRLKRRAQEQAFRHGATVVG